MIIAGKPVNNVHHLMDIPVRFYAVLRPEYSDVTVGQLRLYGFADEMVFDGNNLFIVGRFFLLPSPHRGRTVKAKGKVLII